MTTENVKVAVRVRPFNGREKDRKAQCIIDMQGATTSITDPSGTNDVKKFTFDYSYWSHDGCKDNGTGYYAPDTSHANGKKFADQKKVYDELGTGILNNAIEGYNSTLFAYGQTGSGKSWSMVGYGINKGIVPLYCDHLFKQIDEKRAADTAKQFEVTFSMLEIYNENVRDLLNPSSSKTGLRVRQHPKSGFYADGLQTVTVASYTEIEHRIEEGTRNRTVASTKMNATSSRAHTIVGITFIQKQVNDAGEEMAKTAEVNLVDLAGSERAESTGATGARLKEGAAINQSLSALGNCIAALADRAGGKDTRVPYRNSVLTKLLKNALGGNSKTIMIAALSPADINYDETLSTLRYADRAKQIKTTASINEDPTAQLIRSLQEENEKLKKMLESGKIDMTLMTGGDDEDMTEEEKAQMKKELDEDYKSMVEKNQHDMEEMQKSFEQKLAEAKATGGGYEDIAAINEKKKTYPHLYNLNMDAQMCGHIIHFIVNDKQTYIGSNKDDPEIDLHLRGGGIQERHCMIEEKDGVFTLENFGNNRTLRNGKAVTTDTKTLRHNDRLLFGTTHFYVFANPNDTAGAKVKEPDFEMAQAEIAQKSGGFDMSAQKTREDALLQSELLEVMPGVEEANSIATALKKQRRFDMILVSPEARGVPNGRTEVMIRMTNMDSKHEWMWTRQKFLDRKCIMAEMYDNYEDEDEWDLSKDKDPFQDDEGAPYHIGSVKVWLQSLSYMIESSEQLDITDYKGGSVGKLTVDVLPCDPKGKEYTEKDNMFVENPDSLIGKNIDFKVKIVHARGLPNRFTDVYAKYQVYLEDKYTQTKSVPNTNNPDFNHERIVNLNGTQECVNFLKEGAFIVQIWGKQKDQKAKKGLGKMKSAMSNTAAIHAVNDNVKRFDPEKVKYMMEVVTLKKRQEKMEQKLAHMRKMIETADQHKKKKISTKIISDIYHAPTHDQAEKCIAMIPQEKDSSDSSDSSSDEINKRKPPVGIVPPQKQEKKKHNSSSSSSDSSSSDEEKKKKKEEKKKKKEEKKKLLVSRKSDKDLDKPQKDARPTPTPRKSKSAQTPRSQKGSSSCRIL